MKAPRPLQSPIAKMPGTLVWSAPSTLMWPRSSVATPASSRPRSSVFGRRPVATRRCEPDDRHGLAGHADPDRDLLAPSLDARGVGVGQDPDALALQDLTDRLRYVLVLARDTASLRWMIVTSLPKRRYI